MLLNLQDHARIKAYGKFRFRCRLQTMVWRFFKHQGRDFSLVARLVLINFIQAVKGGQLNIQERSKFLTRTNISDKIELTVILTRDIKDWIEKMAFSQRISQNEVLRMALEWWMETKTPISLASKKIPKRIKSFEAACLKWHNNHIQPRPEEFFFSFWRFAREIYLTFSTPKEASKGFEIINSSYNVFLLNEGFG